MGRHKSQIHWDRLNPRIEYKRNWNRANAWRKMINDCIDCGEPCYVTAMRCQNCSRRANAKLARKAKYENQRS